MSPTMPTLAQIEARWFSPSDRLLAKLARHDPTVAPELRQAVEDDPDYRHCVDLLRAAEAEPDVETAPEFPNLPADHLPLPTWLLDLADRRQTTQTGLRSASLQPGSLVAIDRLIGPEGELTIDLASTAAVLLDDREETPDIWYGWMVGPETSYATAFDFVLEEEDGPCDPALAGMVQLWNPVRVYTGTIARIIGRLPPERLRAIRALAAEYLTRPELGNTGKVRGPIGPRRTLRGYPVTTGTPLEGPSDRRWRYQEIYLQVARAIAEPARAALAARPWWENLWEAIRDSAAFVPETAPAPAMGAAGEAMPREGQVAGRFRLSLEIRNDRVLGLRVTRLVRDGSAVILMRNGQVAQQCRAEDSQKTFLLDRDGDFALEIRGADGQLIEHIDLSEP